MISLNMENNIVCGDTLTGKVKRVKNGKQRVCIGFYGMESIRVRQYAPELENNHTLTEKNWIFHTKVYVKYVNIFCRD